MRRSSPDRPSRLLVPTLVLLSTVTGIVSSLGAPLVPTLAAELGVTLAAAQWTLTVTLLMAAVSTPLLGRYAAAHRRRPTILAGLVVVVAGTVLAAVAVTVPALGLPWLIAGRAAQGVGIALTPLAMTVARDVYPAERSQRIIPGLSVAGVVGAGLGYPLTAAVAQVGGVAAAFWLGVLLTGATLAISWYAVPTAPRGSTPRVQPLEALLLGGSTLAVLLGINQTTSWGWGDVRTLGLFALGVAGAALWAWLTLRSPSPLVDLRLAFGTPALGPHITVVLAGVGMYMSLALVIVLLQTRTPAGWGLDQPVLVAGLVLVPYSLAAVIGTRLSRWAGGYLPAVRLLPIGCALYLASALLIALVHDQVWQALVAMAVGGLGSGFTFAMIPALLVRTAPAAETGSALGFNMVLRYVGFSAGSALGVTVLALASGGPVPTEHGFRIASLVNAAVWLVAIVVVLAIGNRQRPEPLSAGG